MIALRILKPIIFAGSAIYLFILAVAMVVVRFFHALTWVPDVGLFIEIPLLFAFSASLVVVAIQEARKL